MIWILFFMLFVAQPEWDYTFQYHGSDGRLYSIAEGHDSDNPKLKHLQLYGFEKEFPEFSMYSTCDSTKMSFADYFILDPLGISPILTHSCPDGTLRLDQLIVHNGDY